MDRKDLPDQRRLFDRRRQSRSQRYPQSSWLPVPRGEDDYAARYARRHHQGRTNLLFCDGHVEDLKIERVFVDQSDTVLRRWNKDNEPHREQ